MNYRNAARSTNKLSRDIELFLNFFFKIVKAKNKFLIFILASIITYSNLGYVQYDKIYGDFYCNKTCFQFIFVKTIVLWATLLLISIVIFMVLGYRILKEVIYFY